MKAIAIAAALAGCCHWTTLDTIAASSAIVGAGVDLYQTDRYVVPRCAEANPLIGRCGQGIPAGLVIPLSALASVAIAAALPPDYRRYWLGAWNGIEWLTVWNNHQLGY